MAITKKKTKSVKSQKKFTVRKNIQKPADKKELQLKSLDVESSQANNSSDDEKVHEMPISSTNVQEENTSDQINPQEEVSNRIEDISEDEQENNQLEEVVAQKQDDSIFSTPPDSSEGKRKKLWITIALLFSYIIFLLTGFIAGYWYAISNDIKEKNLTEEKVVPTQIPKPTEDEIDLSTYEIQILNGSGVGGIASKEEEILTAQGFNVVAIGNASSSTVSKTEISAKKDVSAKFLNKLLDTLSVNYDVSNDVITLSDEDGFDVIVTIGSSTSSEE